MNDEVRKAAVDLISLGATSAAYSVETKAAGGIRLGGLYPIAENTSVGASVGYIGGPNSDVKITVTPTGAYVGDRKVRFLRFLAEGQQKLPFGEHWAFVLGAGAGLANGSVKEEYTGTGSLASAGTTSNSKTWTGFTAEVSPAFTRMGERIARYRSKWSRRAASIAAIASGGSIPIGFPKRRLSTVRTWFALALQSSLLPHAPARMRTSNG